MDQVVVDKLLMRIELLTEQVEAQQQVIQGLGEVLRASVAGNAIAELEAVLAQVAA